MAQFLQIYLYQKKKKKEASFTEDSFEGETKSIGTRVTHVVIDFQTTLPSELLFAVAL